MMYQKSKLAREISSYLDVTYIAVYKERTIMTIKKLTQILDAHGINYEIVNGLVMAEDVYTYNGELHVDILDLTDISEEQLWDWLGY